MCCSAVLIDDSIILLFNIKKEIIYLKREYASATWNVHLLSHANEFFK